MGISIKGGSGSSRRSSSLDSVSTPPTSRKAHKPKSSLDTAPAFPSSLPFSQVPLCTDLQKQRKQLEQPGCLGLPVWSREFLPEASEPVPMGSPHQPPPAPQDLCPTPVPHPNVLSAFVVFAFCKPTAKKNHNTAMGFVLLIYSLRNKASVFSAKRLC